MGVFKELTESGMYTLPFLLHIYDDDNDFYMINDNAPMTHGGHTYQAAAFQYNPGANGSATLELAIFDKPRLLAYVHGSRAFHCDLVGVYYDSEVVTLETYKHKYGEATWDGTRFQIKLEGDDRGSMTFPALIYNSYNNRGAV